MRHIVSILLLSLLIIVTGCTNESSESNSVDPTTYQSVDIEKAKELIDSGVTIVDVRTTAEYQTGHIPNAVLVPLDEIQQRINEFDASSSYLIVCRSGNRSAQASEILFNAGIKGIYNMNGGMNEWNGVVEVE